MRTPVIPAGLCSTTWDEEKYAFVKEVLWQENGKFVGLDHKIPLGANGIALTDANGLS